MPKTSIFHAALLIAWWATAPAWAAKFTVADLTGKQWCFGKEEAWPKDSIIPRCSDYLPGTVGITVTPEPGELPIQCHGDFQGGEFCTYAADIYVVARHNGQWLIKNSDAWKAVDIAQLAPVTKWPPWSGTTSLGYHVDVAAIDLSSGRAIPPPAGFEVWVGLTPAGSKSFAPGLIKQVYPPPAP